MNRRITPQFTGAAPIKNEARRSTASCGTAGYAERHRITKMVTLTKVQAQELIDTHEIDSILDDEKVRDLLESNNPKLLAAYVALRLIANGQ